MKTMHDCGQSANAIGKALNRSKNTILRHLRVADFSDPQIVKMIEKIKSSELAELHGIGGKARAIINGFLDDVLDGVREPQLIPVVATLDRCFQQRRLLEGGSTQNIDYHATVMETEDLKRKLKELEEIEKRLLEEAEKK